MENEVLVFSRGDLTLAQMIDCMFFMSVALNDEYKVNLFLDGNESFFGLDAFGYIMSFSSIEPFLLGSDETPDVIDFASWVIS